LENTGDEIGRETARGAVGIEVCERTARHRIEMDQRGGGRRIGKPFT
jgi:hypothetical protein